MITKANFNLGKRPKTFVEKCLYPETGIKSGWLKVYAIRGLLVFMAAFGGMGGVLSAFNIHYNIVLVALVYIAVSMALSFARRNPFLQGVAYVGVLIAFTSGVVRYRVYIYSGFQAFNNIVNKAYSDYYGFSAVREVAEIISDREVTVTIAAVFIGIFMMLVFHMIPASMPVLTIMLMISGLYIGKSPNVIYYFFLLSVFVSLTYISGSRHMNPSTSVKKPWKERKKRYIKREKTPLYLYYAKGDFWIPILLTGMAFGLVFSLPLKFTVEQSIKDYTNNSKTGILKQIDNYIKIYTSQGITGFTDRYQARGGISRGKLGGVSGVRPDYQTDLIVTFAPYNREPVYLSAYVGSYYTGSEWQVFNPEKGDVINDIPAEKYLSSSVYAYEDIRNSMDLRFTDQTDAYVDEYRWASEEGIKLSRYTRESFVVFDSVEAIVGYSSGEPLYFNRKNGVAGQMSIENVRAEKQIAYLPYYVKHLNTAYYQSSYDVQYFPYIKGLYWWYDELLEEPTDDIEYTEDAEPFLEVPEVISPCLEDFKANAYEAESFNQKIAYVRNYLSENYSYYMMPGKTPNGRDFVEYFLTEQKEGYCAHFASAGVMMFRSLGIPARYVEGYVIQSSNLADAEVDTEKDTSDYIKGEIPLEETAVLKVGVTDASAHAWVEIYVAGFGWIPVEVTPPARDRDTNVDGQAFWELFTGWFSMPSVDIGNNDMTDINADNTDTNDSDALSDGNWDSFGVLIFILAVAIVYMLFVLFWGLYLRERVRADYDFWRGRYAKALKYYYGELIRRILRVQKSAAFKKKNQITYTLQCSALPEDLLKWLNEYKKIEGAEYEIMLFEKICFAQGEVSKEDAVRVRRFLRGV